MSNSTTAEAAAAAGSLDRAMGRFQLTSTPPVNRQPVRAQAVSLPLVGDVPTVLAAGGAALLVLVLLVATVGGGSNDGAPRVNIN